MATKFSNLDKGNHSWLILVPAIIAFALVLVPTLKFQWPLSWDIFYHIHLSELYMQNGLTYWDPITYAPYGRPIFYAPLFHFTLLTISKIFGLSLFDVARYIQPVFASLIIFSFSYVAYRIYNLTTGFLTGIFVMFTPLFFRMILPIPEAMAMIFLPWIGYFYYISLKNKDFKYVLVAGILWGLTLLTHMLSAGLILLILVVFTMVLKIKERDISLKYFLIFLGSGLAIAALWWAPLLIKYGYVFKSPPAEGYLPDRYLDVFTGIPLVFAFIGLLYGLKRSEKRDLLFISWLLTMLIVSLVYLVGVPVITDRILTFAVFPMMVLAGLGVQQVNFKGFSNDKKPFYALIILITIIGAYTGYGMMEKGQMAVNDSQIDIAQWFKEHGDKKRVVVLDDFLMDPVVVAIAQQPVSAGGYAPGMIKALDINKYFNGTFTPENIINDKTGYVVVKNNSTVLNYAKLVYKNKYYSIFELQKFN